MAWPLGRWPDAWRCSLHGAGLSLPGILDFVVDGARKRLEAMRQAGLHRRLATAEDALADALTAMKQAEGAFDTASDTASDRFDAAERALDDAREDRASRGGTGTRPGKRTSGPM